MILLHQKYNLNIIKETSINTENRKVSKTKYSNENSYIGLSVIKKMNVVLCGLFLFLFRECSNSVVCAAAVKGVINHPVHLT